jgi:hypothetical protein
MASPYKLFKANVDLETQGVIINYGDEAWFKIARSGGTNKRYLKEMGDKLKPFRRQIQTETMDEKVADQIVLEVFVDTVLLGWGSKDADGKDRPGIIDDEDGNPLQFTRENAIRVLKDLPELFRELRGESERLANFVLQTKEADAKN